MPNRAERRAAERAAHQANQASPAAAAAPQPAQAAEPQPVVIRNTAADHTRAAQLMGHLRLIADESPADFIELATGIYAEYNPQSATELRLAESMIQHYWLVQRALMLQGDCLGDDKKLALFLRYQTVHERSYYKAQKELASLQKEKAKQEIGFESQNQKQEAHEAKVRLTHARAQNLEIDTACRQVMEASLPGNYRISFEQLTHACPIAISSLVSQQQAQAAS